MRNYEKLINYHYLPDSLKYQYEELLL